MSLFISDALAQGAGAPPPDGGLLGLVPLLIIFIIFYFLLIRPQVKRAKEHKKMVESLTVGDEIVTTGGLVGKVVAMDEGFLTLDVGNGMQLVVQRNAVAAVVPKGTLKAALSGKSQED